jgi:hypothetical protein
MTGSCSIASRYASMPERSINSDSGVAAVADDIGKFSSESIATVIRRFLGTDPTERADSLRMDGPQKRGDLAEEIAVAIRDVETPVRSKGDVGGFVEWAAVIRPRAHSDGHELFAKKNHPRPAQDRCGCCAEY